MRYLPTLVIAFLCLMLPALSAGQALENLDTLKHELIQYHDSGAYLRDIAKQDGQAKAYLAKRIQKNNALAAPKKLALVLDIDETSLSNYPDLRREDFGYYPKQADKAVLAAHDKVIQPSLDLYNFAKKNHVAVFFITGRKENLRQATIKNLHRAGFNNWDHLYLKPIDYKNKSAIPYKKGIRQAITKQGYDIVLSVGDQYSDLRGGYADKGIKLPNPYYLIA